MADIKISGLPAASSFASTDEVELNNGGTSRKATLAQWFGALFAAVGQLKFPATQVASSDANTLDDYQEFTWTPVLTFATPGDLSVAYSVQSGTGNKTGNRVDLDFHVATSTFTHTTASGNCQITGAPDNAVSLAGSITFAGEVIWAGVTKASYTQVNPRISDATSTILFLASGSGQASSAVTSANMPTGGAVLLNGNINYPTET